MNNLYSGQLESIYSQLLDSSISRTSSLAKSSFNHYVSNINGIDYIYRSIFFNGENIKISLGRYHKDLDYLLKKDLSETEDREMLVGMLISGGAIKHPNKINRVIEMIADFKIFESGGVLIGSNAFTLYSNMLGCKFDDSYYQTEDVDIASSNSTPFNDSIDILFDNKMDISAENEMLSKGFSRILSLNRKDPATSFSNKNNIHVDLLTPMIGKEDHSPIKIRKLNSFAEPLRFLDYLMKDTQIGVVLHNNGILVRVPEPARFALHKLVVSERRLSSFKGKSKKDIAQSGALLEYLFEFSKSSIIKAIDASLEMPKSFQRALKSASDNLPEEISVQLNDLINKRRRDSEFKI